MLDIPIIIDKHKKIILKLSDDRNAFVHYKFNTEPDEVEINKEENPESIYKEIWDKYLKPIRKLIIDKKDDEALVDYKEMVRDLQKRFLK